MYKVTANFKHRYLKYRGHEVGHGAMPSLAADGSGNAIWTVGGTVGRQADVMKNAAGWESRGSTGLCLARVADKKYQI